MAVASSPATSAAATGLVGAKLAVLKWLGAGFVLGTTGVGAVELARVGTAERTAPTPAVSAPSTPRNSSPRPLEQPVLARSPQLAAEAERPSAVNTFSRALPGAPSVPAPAKINSTPLPAYSAAFPAPTAPPPVSNGDPGRFAAQLELVDRARRAVAEGKPHQAEVLLDQLEREHPGTSFGPEAVALRVEALMKSGNRGAAEALSAALRPGTSAASARATRAFVGRRTVAGSAPGTGGPSPVSRARHGAQSSSIVAKGTPAEREGWAAPTVRTSTSTLRLLLLGPPQAVHQSHRELGAGQL
jgi:hypothetical protein